MVKKISSTRDWIEKYLSIVQNKELLTLLKKSETIQESGPWSFLKLAFLWCFAQTYTNIIGYASRYKNICYVDLFSGCGMSSFEDYGRKTNFLLGSPVMMATAPFKNPFKKCFFFEKDHENFVSLSKRVEILKNNNKLTCTEYKIFEGDCNENVDELIKILKKLPDAHFLLFVDPYSTEIKWSTMEKLLSLNYPAFDMIFNFQPFGINRKSCYEDTLPSFFGEAGYQKYLGNLELLESYYIEKLRKFKMAKTTKIIKIESGGSGGFYYDLIYATRKEFPGWINAIEHIKSMIESTTGHEIKIIADPSLPRLDKIS